MSEADTPVARFEFTMRGLSEPRLRGSQFALYPGSLVHRGAAGMETVSLAALAAVRVGFERDQGKIGWAVILVVIAALLVLAAGPLGNFAIGAASEVAGSGGVAAGLHQLLGGLALFARALPVLAVVLVLGALALGALGWIGRTVLTLTVGASERRYAVPGRDARLLDFAEALGERLMLARR